MQVTNRLILPFFIVFTFLTAAVILGWNLLLKYHIDPWVLIGANFLVLLASLLVFFIQKKALSNKNPNVFVRAVMSGMMIKMAICVVAVLAYTFSAGDDFNKKGLFIGMFFYLIYLAVEVRSMSKLNRSHHA
jgi:hypothetical protein